MENFKVHILGCGSALPTMKHFPSAQVVEVRDKMFLVDCGEGTQLQLRRSHVRFTKITSVFISHLHGDHCFGLIGLISTFGLLGRTAPLHVYAPSELEEMLNQQVSFFCSDLGYNVVFHAVDTTKSLVIYEDRCLTVTTIPLVHRKPCCGFLFKEKPSLPHIRRDVLDAYGIPLSQVNNIKNGADWVTEDGEVIPNSRMVRPADKPRSYAYCSDTSYMRNLHKMVEGVDALYHESTYISADEDKAKLYNHSTSRQAAMVARDACAGKLILGHFSARYDDERVLLDEAKEIFENTIMAAENSVIDVR